MKSPNLLEITSPEALQDIGIDVDPEKAQIVNYVLEVCQQRLELNLQDMVDAAADSGEDLTEIASCTMSRSLPCSYEEEIPNLEHICPDCSLGILGVFAVNQVELEIYGVEGALVIGFQFFQRSETQFSPKFGFLLEAHLPGNSPTELLRNIYRDSHVEGELGEQPISSQLGVAKAIAQLPDVLGETYPQEPKEKVEST